MLQHVEVIQKTVFVNKGFRHCFNCLGTVYTDAVLFVTASISMRTLRLSFTRRRSSSSSEPSRFEYAFKSGAFSKRYGFIGLVNGETASI